MYPAVCPDVSLSSERSLPENAFYVCIQYSNDIYFIQMISYNQRVCKYDGVCHTIHIILMCSSFLILMILLPSLSLQGKKGRSGEDGSPGTKGQKVLPTCAHNYQIQTIIQTYCQFKILLVQSRRVAFSGKTKIPLSLRVRVG